MATNPNANTTVLITGANRGRALTSRFLLRSSTTVVAGVRRFEDQTTQSLSKLPHGESSKLITVKIDSTSDSDALEAVKLIQNEHDINQLDIVVANAGYGTVFGDLSQVKPSEVRDLVDINAIGPLRLFQAVRSLLESGNSPRFILIGTPIASIAAMEKSPFPMFAYGASKTSAHYLTRKIHCESPGLISFAVDPGFMQTDMGNTGARHFGYEQAFVPVDTAADFVFGEIWKATRQETSGQFLSIDESRGFIEW
ncbi:putative Norsolorinic acid ketoreductase [Seiridium unicorne]|uniref:Norsolorinic acid ketoreductase n=1 Tax=Seiridium unicorne TaxID=138068 RepID=A0ABR2V2G0_9PEZI